LGNPKTIAIVPARKGSKGVKNKNLLTVQGRSLIEWAVKVGVDCPLISDVYISTDSEEYEQVAKNAGAKSLGLRPDLLATDTTKTVDVVLEMLQHFREGEIQNILLLQPTSPLRSKDNIETALQILEREKVDAVVSVSEFIEPHPYKLKRIESGLIKPFVETGDSEMPRQLLPKAYCLTGAIYLITVDALSRSRSFLPSKVAPLVTKDLFVNIDSAADFEYLNFLVSSGKITLPD
jgi:CMP-N,N'-diacetyllegionaminic acid synthase